MKELSLTANKQSFNIALNSAAKKRITYASAAICAIGLACIAVAIGAPNFLKDSISFSKTTALAIGAPITGVALTALIASNLAANKKPSYDWLTPIEEKEISLPPESPLFQELDALDKQIPTDIAPSSENISFKEYERKRDALNALMQNYRSTGLKHRLDIRLALKLKDDLPVTQAINDLIAPKIKALIEMQKELLTACEGPESPLSEEEREKVRIERRILSLQERPNIYS